MSCASRSLGKSGTTTAWPQNSRPLVSVIMNCRDAAKTLPATLASLREQTFQNFEVIVWDNASHDGSGHVAQACAAGLPNFRYYYEPTPMRLGAARDTALALARGDFIAFLDCDDLWRPEKLAVQMALLQKQPHVGMVCSDTAQLLHGRLLRRTFFQWTRPERGMVFDALVCRQWASMSSMLLRRAALESIRLDGRCFDHDLEVCEDADVAYRVAHDWPCDYVDAPLTVWRMHEHNATLRKFGLFAQETRHLVEKYRRIFPHFSAQHAVAEAALLDRAAFREAVALWQHGHGSTARQLLRGRQDLKARLMRCVTWLPSWCFANMARLYWRWR